MSDEAIRELAKRKMLKDYGHLYVDISYPAVTTDGRDIYSLSDAKFVDRIDRFYLRDFLKADTDEN